MEGNISIGPFRMEVDFSDASNPETFDKISKLLDAHTEQIEAAIASAVMVEIEKVLPGIKVTCTGSRLEDE